MIKIQTVTVMQAMHRTWEQHFSLQIARYRGRLSGVYRNLSERQSFLRESDSIWIKIDKEFKVRNLADTREAIEKGVAAFQLTSDSDAFETLSQEISTSATLGTDLFNRACKSVERFLMQQLGGVITKVVAPITNDPQLLQLLIAAHAQLLRIPIIAEVIACAVLRLLDPREVAAELAASDLAPVVQVKILRMIYGFGLKPAHDLYTEANSKLSRQ